MKSFLNEDGAITVIVALSLTLLLSCAALILDLGKVYILESEIQNAADAATLAAGKLLPVESTDTLGKEKITEMAQQYAQKNGSLNPTQDVHVNLSGDVGSTTLNTLNVSITSKHYYNFAKIVGVNSVTITKDATISVGPVSGVKGAVPVGITRDAFIKAKELGEMHNVVLKYGGGDGTNGYFGFIVLDGNNASDNDLLNWFEYGFINTINVGETFPNATGNKANVAKMGVEYRMSLCTHFKGQGGCNTEHYVDDCPRVVKCLIYDQLSNGNVKVVGFAPFIIESVDNDATIHGSYLDIVTDEGETGKLAFDAGLHTLKLVK